MKSGTGVLRKLFGLGCLAGVIGWLALALFIYLGQDDMLFHPQPVSAERVAELRARPGVEELAIMATDGTVLRGWLVATGPAPRPVVVLYGGNADEISRYADEIDMFCGWSLALVCYRGYGKSGGRPGAVELLEDAAVVFDAIAARPDIDRRRMVVLGRSLGSGIAACVAGRRAVAGTVLISPYDRLGRVAQSRLPFLPVGLLLRHEIAAAAGARLARSPLLAVYAPDDATIAAERSLALAAAWPGPKTVLATPGYGHNDLTAAPEYHAALRDFLRQM